MECKGYKLQRVLRDSNTDLFGDCELLGASQNQFQLPLILMLTPCLLPEFKPTVPLVDP